MINRFERIKNKFLENGADVYDFKGREYLTYTPSECMGDFESMVDIDEIRGLRKVSIKKEDFRLEIYDRRPDNWTARIDYLPERGSFIWIRVSDKEWVDVFRASGFVSDIANLLAFTRQFIDENGSKIYDALWEVDKKCFLAM